MTGRVFYRHTPQPQASTTRQGARTMANKYSKNNKLNSVLMAIEESLLDLGVDEVKRYRQEFKYQPDFNIAQYGNLLVYYGDVYDLYRECGYTSTDKFSEDKIWKIYKRQVGYVARRLTR